MTRKQLEHAIRAACDVAEDTELIIFGSQAILAEHPDAPPELRASIEVDVQPVNRPDAVDLIDGALGEWAYGSLSGSSRSGRQQAVCVSTEGSGFRTGAAG